MKNDQATRWVRLFIRVVVASLGTYVTAQSAGGHGVATWAPAIIAGLTTLEAGLSQAPSGPVETTVVNAPSDPVQTQEVKP